MNERDIEFAKQAGLQPFEDCGPKYVYKMEKFAALIRADEREAFVKLIQEYPEGLRNSEKRELIDTIRARGNT